jgi:hypothetical protein
VDDILCNDRSGAFSSPLTGWAELPFWKIYSLTCGSTLSAIIVDLDIVTPINCQVGRVFVRSSQNVPGEREPDQKSRPEVVLI